MDKLAGKTILVVDDEKDIRDALEFEFELRGLRVLTANGGIEGLEVIKKGEKIDLILCDVRMSKGSGIDLLTEVRKLDPNVPIVAMITGFTNIPDDTFLDSGAMKVFRKPLRMEEIFESFEEALA